MGIFFVFTTLSILTGWGNSHISSFANSTENPVFLLAKRLWGAAWVLVPGRRHQLHLGRGHFGDECSGSRVFLQWAGRGPCRQHSPMSIRGFAHR